MKSTLRKLLIAACGASAIAIAGGANAGDDHWKHDGHKWGHHKHKHHHHHRHASEHRRDDRHGRTTVIRERTIVREAPIYVERPVYVETPVYYERPSYPVRRDPAIVIGLDLPPLVIPLR